MNYSIRRAQLQDSTGLARLQVDSYRQTYTPFFPPAYIDHFSYDEQERDWRDLLTSDLNDNLLVACSQDGDLLGYALSRLDDQCFPGYASEIVALHVKGTAQRCGLGSALLKASSLTLQDAGAMNTMLWTLRGNPVRAWYERLGGIFLGEKHFQVDEREIEEVAYGWSQIELLIHQLDTQMK